MVYAHSHIHQHSSLMLPFVRTSSSSMPSFNSNFIWKILRKKDWNRFVCMCECIVKERSTKNKSEKQTTFDPFWNWCLFCHFASSHTRVASYNVLLYIYSNHITSNILTNINFFKFTHKTHTHTDNVRYMPLVCAQVNVLSLSHIISTVEHCQ